MSNGKVGRLYFVHAHTPIHVGVGEGLGAINLPTLREEFTGFPLVPGSSVKGVLRAMFRDMEPGGEGWSDSPGDRPDAPDSWKVFGPPTDYASLGRGGVVFGDALLLALPVRSLVGLFGWFTCPYALQRLARDATVAVRPGGAEAPPDVPQTDGDRVLFPNDGDSALLLQEGKGQPPILLEEHELDARPDGDAARWARWIAERVWGDDDEASSFFRSRFAIVSDTVMGQLVQTALEVRPRVRIDHRFGVAAESGPWLEELIPTETLLAGLVHGRATAFSRPPREDEDRAEEQTRATMEEGTLEEHDNEVGVEGGDAIRALESRVRRAAQLRFGGKSSVGYGRATLQVWP
ncbi:MAG: type III-B CRISPR module RAMP protein Cmr4 [Myxococcota bacterium]